MKTTGRFLTLALSLALALSACTGDGDGGDGGTGGTGGTSGTGGSGSTGEGGGGPTPVVSGSATGGTYEYENAGLRVVLVIEGTAGTMEVENETGHGLDRPGFYLLDADDGHQIDGEVREAAPVSSGETATFEISFEGTQVGDIGAIALLFGADNYGLFVRTA
jgi:hypothetical protein